MTPEIDPLGEYETKFPLQQLNAELDSLWLALEKESALREEVAALGLSEEEKKILAAPRKDTINFRTGEQHADPGTISLIVVLAPYAKKIGKDLWEKVLLPHLRRKFGDNVVQRKRKK
jgi:hypothetical protein